MNENNWATPCPKYDCRKTACKCGLEYVNIPASLGDDSEGSNVAPKNGAYCNALVIYEANNHVYIYSKEGVPTLIDVDASDISTLEQEVRKAQKDVYELREDIDDFIYGYDTVASMKLASNLDNGDRVRTYGYYAKNDGGGAYYRVVNSVPSGPYETLGNLLYAELIIEDSMNVLQFGIRNDTASTNYTTTIQKALKCGTKNLTFNAGTYTITAGLEVGCSVYGSSTGKTTISFPTADPTKYSLKDSIFIIYDQYNIEVKGMNLIGSFSDDNPGPRDGTSEHAHAFALRNAHDITIRGCNAKKIFGDFAYIGGGRVGEAHEGQSTNILIENCTCDEFKRNFASFIHSDRVYIYGCTITKEHANVSVFDIEPNDNRQKASNVVIKDNYITCNCVVLTIARGISENLPKSVTMANNYIVHCSNLFSATAPSDGEPYVDNLVLENNYVKAIDPTIFGSNTRIRGIKSGIVRGNTIPQEVLIRYSENLIVEGNTITGSIIQDSKDITVTNNNSGYFTIKDSEYVMLSNNTIKRGLYNYDGNCIWVRSGSKISIINNSMSLVRYAVRIQLDGNVDNLAIKNNIIITSQYGIYVNPTDDYTATNTDLCDNEVFYSQQGDSAPRSLVPLLDQINKQYDTSNYFKMTGLDTYTAYNVGIKGQYVKNTKPTLLSDANGSYYLKGWLCVDAENQTWIADKLRV